MTESGSCFVQISDENVHLVRSIMDEILGSENFVSQITFTKTAPLGASFLPNVCDYFLFYAKNKEKMKFRNLFEKKPVGRDTGYQHIMLEDGTKRALTKEEKDDMTLIPEGAELFNTGNLISSGKTPTCIFDFEFEGRIIKAKSNSWKTTKSGVENLIKKDRLYLQGNTIYYVRKFSDFPVKTISNVWDGMRGDMDMRYVVQTSSKAIQRCLLMTADPGDLVLDPTCGSGTTAFVAEQYGRRWITVDTSRIALNIAKQRLMTSVFPFYKLYDEKSLDIRQGFQYRTVPHISLGSEANNEPTPMETLYDQPFEDKKKLRVSGPFTVETLQNFEPITPEELDNEVKAGEDEGAFEEVIKQHLVSAGIKNGRKEEMVIFTRVELLGSENLHAEGFYMNGKGEKKSYFFIGPKFGTVSKKQVNDAIKECRNRGDAQWLVILGFSFESDIEGSTQTTSMGTFEVTKARIHDDLLQEGLKKKPSKSAASFVTIGEPDIAVNKNGKEVTIEIQGLDIYDPIKDEVKARNVSDIAYWMLDDDYDGSNLIVKQVLFCGGEKTEFDKWKKGLSDFAKQDTKRKVEKTLKVEIDEEAFDRLYGHISHPIEITKKGQKIAVRVISQFGEETMKVIVV